MDWYVSPNGSNVTGSGSQDKPWQTISHAIGRSQLAQGDTVWAMGVKQAGWSEPVGIYRETSSSKAGVWIKGYPGHKIIISGLDIVSSSGWTVHSGNIYKTSAMTWTMNDASRSQGNNLLFYSQQGQLPTALVEARWPNVPKEKTVATLVRSDWAEIDSAKPTTSGTEGQLVTSQITDADLAQFPNGSLVGAKICFLPGAMWTVVAGTVTSHSGTTLTVEHKYKNGTVYQLKAKNRYFLFGKLAFLTQAGEWFRDDSSGSLYLWMPDNSHPEKWIIEAKKRDAAIDGWGKGILVEDITFIGARLKTNLAATVRDCTLLNATHNFYISAPYEYTAHAITAPGGGTIENCTIRDNTSGAIDIAGGIVRNCTIQNSSYSGAKASGILVKGSNNIIDNNIIDGAGEARMIDLQCSNSIVQNNQISNGSRLTLDEGAIFCWRGSDGGTNKVIVRKNLVDASMQIYDASQEFYGYAALYIENVKGFVVESNIFTGTARVALVPAVGKACSVEFYHNVFNGEGIFWQPSSQYNYAGTIFKNNFFKKLMDTSIRSDMVFVKNASSAVAYANNLLVAEPKFANANFEELLPDSPLCNAGEVITGINDDYSGTAPDICPINFGGQRQK